MEAVSQAIHRLTMLFHVNNGEVMGRSLRFSEIRRLETAVICPCPGNTLFGGAGYGTYLNQHRACARHQGTAPSVAAPFADHLQDQVRYSAADSQVDCLGRMKIVLKQRVRAYPGRTLLNQSVWSRHTRSGSFSEFILRGRRRSQRARRI